MSQATVAAESPDLEAGPWRNAEASAGQEDGRHLAWLMSGAAERRDKPYQYLLTLRFALINMMAFALLGAAYAHGLIDRVVQSDHTYLSVGIFVVFLGGLVVAGWRIIQTSRELNQVKSFDPLTRSAVADYLARSRGRSGSSRSILAGAVRLRLAQRISMVRNIANSLVLLGLIGTVVGFIIALSGVDPERASDVKSIGPMVATLIDGMSTALYTTLVGSVLNVWLMINYRLLSGGTVKLVTALIELGERDGRS